MVIELTKEERIEFVKDCTYQGFYFRSAIKSYFYEGDTYFGADELPNEQRDQVVDELIEQTTQSPEIVNFFPQLKLEMEAVFGFELFLYDFYEISPDGDFMLFWDIKTEFYPQLMEKLEQWMKYMKLEWYMCFHVKDITSDPDKQEFLKWAGDKQVMENYYGN
jgi:hypothetical protein